MVEEIFKEFKITVPLNRRYYDDDTAGLLVKQGQVVTVGQRHFRSAELRSALLKSQVLIVEGECLMAFKQNMMKISKGEDQLNKLEIISGPEFDAKKEESKEEVAPEVVVEEPKEVIVEDVKIEMPLKTAINVKSKISEEKENGKKIGQHSTE
ncbi:MAG: hypothetical protein D4S01_10985 [Dehalococcoidia bacterium]|nr:MAG: hypothetical protein D4S01_10985 [Dehalococcoidia bacterium]